MIIGVGSRKGGAGKSTITWNLGIWYARNRRVAVLDRDPQSAIQQFAAQRVAAGHGQPPMQIYGDLAESMLTTLQSVKADLALIDTPPTIGGDFLRLAEVCHRILIPVRPGVPDAAALIPSIETLLEQDYPANEIIIVPNGIDPRLRLAGESLDHLRETAEMLGCRLADKPCFLCQRTIYGNSLKEGRGVTECPKNDAIPEIASLAKFIRGETLPRKAIRRTVRL